MQDYELLAIIDFMFTRDISPKVLAAAKDYPVVTIIGPRQSGKTTLVKNLFPDKPYVNLEKPDIQSLLKEDPNQFLAQYESGAIFDEIQNVPELLSYIQVIVDEANQEGLFILTGSEQLSLNESITQSLAGRTAVLELLPLSMHELQQANFDYPQEKLLLHGGLPRIYQKQLDPTEAYRNYLKTYLERDVRQLINLKDFTQYHKFVKLLAGRVGQIFNASSLSNDLGVSVPTVNSWLSVLEASYIVFRLHPYHENFGKRVIKSPKIYFTDVGLVSYLLEIESEHQVSRDPLRGQLVENLVVLELMKTRFNQGKDANLYFFRDSTGHEIDVLYKRADQLIPIEIKASQTFSKSFLKNMKFFRGLVGERCAEGYVIYAGKQESTVHEVHLVNYKNTSSVLESKV